MTISAWLRSATAILKAIGITSARLDAEIILAHTLNKSRTYLHAHIDEVVDQRYQDIANARLSMRVERTPIAYIVGHKEFYGRRFKVTPSTLIPRPESESIIELLLKYTATELAPKSLVDVGTGSGCLGITAKLERPNLNVTLIDISRPALSVAGTNAAQLGAQVAVIRSDLLANYPGVADYIVANLPYVDSRWQRSPETDYEPESALFAKDDGLFYIKRLLDQSRGKTRPGSLWFIEADPEQHDAIISYAQGHKLKHIDTDWYCLVFQES